MRAPSPHPRSRIRSAPRRSSSAMSFVPHPLVADASRTSWHRIRASCRGCRTWLWPNLSPSRLFFARLRRKSMRVSTSGSGHKRNAVPGPAAGSSATPVRDADNSGRRREPPAPPATACRRRARHADVGMPSVGGDLRVHTSIICSRGSDVSNPMISDNSSLTASIRELCASRPFSVRRPAPYPTHSTDAPANASPNSRRLLPPPRAAPFPRMPGPAIRSPPHHRALPQVVVVDLRTPR